MSFLLPEAVELLERAARNRRLAHAYLVTGPIGSGKAALARRLVAMGGHELSGEEGDLEALRSGTVTVVSPESRSRRITVDAIRSMEHTLHMAASPGKTKFAVIRDADRMSQEASNAFLKTLEEPPDASRLLLLTARPELLLETILSRCIRINLRPEGGRTALPESSRTLLEVLRRHAESGARGVNSSLELMDAFVSILKEEKEAIAKRNEAAFKEERARFRDKTESEDYFKRKEEGMKAGSEAEYLQQRAQAMELLLMWFGDAMRQRHGGRHLDLPEFADSVAAFAKRFDDEELSRRVGAVESLLSHLGTTVNETLALEVAFVRAFA